LEVAKSLVGNNQLKNGLIYHAALTCKFWHTFIGQKKNKRWFC